MSNTRVRANARPLTANAKHEQLDGPEPSGRRGGHDDKIGLAEDVVAFDYEIRRCSARVNVRRARGVQRRIPYAVQTS